MSLIDSDRGGTAVPAPKTDPKRGAKTTASTPSSNSTTTASPNKPTGRRGASATTFAKHARMETSEARLSLADAVRTAKSAAKHAAAPTGASTTARDRRDAAANPSKANDGRADSLRSGGHDGDRDTKIAALKQTQASLVAQENVVTDQIGKLESEITSDEGKTSAAGTVATLASAPLSLVAGMFGKESPAKTAAEAVTSKLLGLAGDKRELQTKQADLQRKQDAIASQIKQLEDERVLNFLADSAHVTGMDGDVADFIEDGKLDVDGDLTVRLAVADETGTGSDGVYDSGTDEITIDSQMIDDSKNTMDQLREQGVVDSDGNIIDEKTFDGSAAADDVIKAVSLVGVHEVNHATQQASGTFAPAFRAKQKIINDAVAAIPDSATPAKQAKLLAQAQERGERTRTAMIEVDSYRVQEQNDLSSGAVKKAFITIDKQGAPLPRQQQVDNVVAYQEGKPLPFGPSAGHVRESAGEDDHEHEGDHAADGYRGPGDTADGYRGPGYRGPGDTADGYRGPGYRGPGDTADGYRGPGYRGPGDTADGYRGPGYRGPGDTADGYRGPGYRGPGYRGPGNTAD